MLWDQRCSNCPGWQRSKVLHFYACKKPVINFSTCQRQHPIWRKSFARHEVWRASLGMQKQILADSSDFIDVLPLASSCPKCRWWRFLMWDVFFSLVRRDTATWGFVHRLDRDTSGLLLRAKLKPQTSIKCQPLSDLAMGCCRMDCNRSYIGATWRCRLPLKISLGPWWGILHQNFHGWNLKIMTSHWISSSRTAFSSFGAAMFLREA